MSHPLSARLMVTLFVVCALMLSAEAQTSVGLIDTSTSITATSVYTDKIHPNLCQPSDISYSLTDRCWCSVTAKCTDNPMLNIQLGGIYMITKVGVKPCSWPSSVPWGNESVTSYKIAYYYDDTWLWYKDGQSLQGNMDGCCDEELTHLSPAVMATQIRMYPLNATVWCSSNFEVYGYPLTQAPTLEPTFGPTFVPTLEPTIAPTSAPSTHTVQPTNRPSDPPIHYPSFNPSINPTIAPSRQPTNVPTGVPTSDPTHVPTASPTTDPSQAPSRFPSAVPTESPSANPSTHPSSSPTVVPIYTTEMEDSVSKDTSATKPNYAESVTRILVIIIVILGVLIGAVLLVWWQYDKLQKSELEIKENRVEEQVADFQSGIDREDVSDVAELMGFFTDFVQLPQYLDVFLSNGYFALKHLEDIQSISQLQNEFGISDSTHQEFIMSAIDALRTESKQTNTNVQHLNAQLQISDPIEPSSVLPILAELPSINPAEPGCRLELAHVEVKKSNPETPSTTMSDHIRLIPGVSNPEMDKSQLSGESDRCAKQGAIEGAIVQSIDSNENQKGDESDGDDSGDFDDMFVKEETEESQHTASKSMVARKQTTKGDEIEATATVSFHGTKGEYYDEYHHTIYEKR